MHELPIIDLAASEQQVAEELTRAYTELGFAGLVNHGIDRSLLDALFDVSRRFHALPAAAKNAIALNEHHRGFIARGSSTDASSEYEEVTTANQSESFMMLGPVAHGRFLDGPNQWPELDGFRDTLEHYHQVASALGARIVHYFGVLLGEPLDAHFDMPTAWLRLLRYPAQAKHSAGYGSAPHRDYGAITLLAQDGVPGLEVLSPRNEWIEVEADPDVLVLNTGEVMHRWSNGTVLRTPHRVRNRSGRERYSIPFFFDPDMRTHVEPLASSVGPQETPRFPSLAFEDFVRGELQAGYDRHQVD